MPYIANLIVNILTSGLPCCLVALGIFITYRLLDIADLTAEGSFLMGGATTLSLILCGWNAYSATLIGLLLGFVCGIVTGLLITKLKIPPLLSGIITLTGCTSMGYLVMGWPKKGSIFNNLVSLGSKNKNMFDYLTLFKNEYKPLNEVLILFLIVLIMIIVLYIFFGTEIGMSIRATGMNQNMARAQGINTSLMTILGLGISNAVIALGGALFAQDMGSMEIRSSSGFLVIGLAAILMGESIFGKRSFKNWIISVSLGGIVYYIVVTAALELGFPTQLKNLLYALLITFALCLPIIKEKTKLLFKKIKKGDKQNA